MSTLEHPSPADFMAHTPKAMTLPNGNTAWAASYASQLREIIVRHEIRSPRSMQTWLGPSEIGDPCDRAVVGKMAGVPRTNNVPDPWAAFLGSAGHARLAETFERENQLDQRPYPRWLAEHRVVPHPNHPGTADLYDADTFSVVDWKLLGPGSMAKARRPEGPPARYVIQLLLYGQGYRNEGKRVDRVVLAALPRTESSLDGMFIWEHQCGAVDQYIIDVVLAKNAVRQQLAGEILAGRMNIGQIPITPSDDGCFFCPQFRPESARDGGPGCPGHSLPR